MQTIHTTLPRGIYSGATCYRAAVLRPLTGRQEAAIASRPPDARALSHILADRLVRVGGLEEPSARRILLMTRGDRAHMLLTLRAAMLGDDLRLTLRCPNPTCRSPIPVLLSIAEITAVSASTAAPQIQVDTAIGPALLREPCGEDDAVLEEVTEEPSSVLWSRILLRLGERAGLSPGEWSKLPSSVRYTIAMGLARHHRGPTLAGSAQCPACRAWQEWQIDPAALLSAELRVGASRIVDEIHALAWHYHWSEDAILDMPRQRRWRYLELLTETLN